MFGYWRTTDFTVERTRAKRLPLGCPVARSADEFVKAGVDYALVGANGVFSDVDAFGWHDLVKKQLGKNMELDREEDEILL